MPCVLNPGLTAPAGTSRSSPVSGTTPLAASCPAAIFITRFQSRKSIHEQRHGPQIRLSGHPDCRGRTVAVAAAPQTTDAGLAGVGLQRRRQGFRRSEEHTSELQSLMRISYAVF